ncbi:MAG TPA: hypothetical protein VE172_22040 [Stackebrandtia sp.]|jgi:uncharacterized peroxidase-related enzyme|uniref:carboxymuconolactone decarboxylase family protein n=1 Tax=Stackebrandtia sp. TaxID=2023065 RepID=UPI002D2C384B|nr:hypothetical protein [Stackebrandtia sp.]HZE41490.1 hypothetical protein [Stackebrandtia sp.]
MRPEILNNGYGFGAKALFAIVRIVSRRSLPDAAKLTFYRPDFYGSPAKEFTHQAMRGPSAWSVGERELMAAYVSKQNESPFCVGAHTSTAAQALGDEPMVAGVLSDLDTAPIAEPLRATLRMLGKLTREHTVDADDMRELRSQGVTRAQIEDALAVCFAFNVTNRLADAFDFSMLTPAGFDSGAAVLLKRGYH